MMVFFETFVGFTEFLGFLRGFMRFMRLSWDGSFVKIYGILIGIHEIFWSFWDFFRDLWDGIFWDLWDIFETFVGFNEFLGFLRGFMRYMGLSIFGEIFERFIWFTGFGKGGICFGDICDLWKKN